VNQPHASPSVSGALLLFVLWGLLSAPPAPAEENVRRATPLPGKALVFVFRSEREPVPAQVPVLVNLVPIGNLANGTFATATVSPGRTHLRIGDRILTLLSFKAVAGQSYFVQVEAISGVRPVRTRARAVSETEGRRLVAQSRFVGVAPAERVAASRPQRPPAAKTAAPPSRQPSPAAQPATGQPAAAPQISLPPEPGRTSEFALIAYGGAFKMANGNQVIAGLATTYDVNSNSVYGVEAEWRSKVGIAVGAEVFHYENDLVATGIPGARQKVLATMLSGKYYFRLRNWLYPFVGAGVGYAAAAFSDGFTGKTEGVAYQGLAGLEFRFKPIGFYAQYKYLASTTGDPGGQVKVGGSAVLAGISVFF